MRNWVLFEDESVAGKMGEFLLQVTTVEFLLESLYGEFVDDDKKRKAFSDMTFGRKVGRLFEKISLGVNLQERLDLLLKNRNIFFHNAIAWDPISGYACMKVGGPPIMSEIDVQNKQVKELMTDLYVVLLRVKDTKCHQFKAIITR
jgi:hypothetical protein